jgi:hypothetical protein
MGRLNRSSAKMQPMDLQGALSVDKMVSERENRVSQAVSLFLGSFHLN